MTHSYNHRPLAVSLALLLAAALACSPLASPAAPSGAPLTQAAATITAAANVIVTSRAAATLHALGPTPAPPTSAPAAAATAAASAAASATPGATLVPTTAASPSTADPGATGTAASTPGGAVVVDPCSLITAAEVQSLLGVALKTPKVQNGGCLFVDAATGFTQGLALYAVPASQTQYFFEQYVAELKFSGIKIDSTATDKLNADIAGGDTVASLNDLLAMAVGQPSFHAVKLDGVGSAALWSWNAAGNQQAATLFAAKPGALVGLVLAAGASAKETDVQPPVQTIVSRTLVNLPANFTVSGLQVAGSAPVLDPCSLATASDAATILGAKAADGVAEQGYCTFNDAANSKLFVRVFAFPAGVAAAGALNSVESIVLIGNTAAQNQLATDIAAGDLVAAVTHLAASGQSGGGRTLESVVGLGDASMFFIQKLGSQRIGYVLAAKPGVLAGVQMLLALGDDAATKTAAVPLMTNILQGLPDKFTVSGAP